MTSYLPVFIKRRAEVAVDMGKVFAAEVMNPENITKALLKELAADELFKLIERQVKFVLDTSLGRADATEQA